jgi:flagellar basal body-associated protein FliL
MVGDKESNSAIMAEYYNEPAPVKKSRWWIAAIILAIIALVTIATYYFNDRNGMFGNAQKSEAPPEPKTYTVP